MSEATRKAIAAREARLHPKKVKRGKDKPEGADRAVQRQESTAVQAQEGEA